MVNHQGHIETSDALVIARSLNERELFAELFERHFSLVYRFLCLRVGMNSASDLAAETFAVAFRRRADYDVQRIDARPWLLGIAANLARAEVRTERRRREALLRLAREQVPPRDDGLGGLGATDERLSAALQVLAPEERDLLLLFGCVGLTYAEIAEALSLPIGTVRSRISRLRSRVRPLLRPDTEEAKTSAH
jgi:RNA polymerase sigma-70 factor (ECF subfamily)